MFNVQDIVHAVPWHAQPYQSTAATVLSDGFSNFND